MALRNDDRRYGTLAQLLHWGIALLVLVQFPLAVYMTDLPVGLEKIELYNLHKSLGLTVLALMLLRLAWRQISPPPPLPPMPAWERRAAAGAHVLLYLLLFAQPLLGLLFAFASGFPTVVFGLFTLPSPLAADQGLADLSSELHESLGWALSLVILIHIGAALRHHLVLKDDVLRRMLPGAR